MIDGDEDHRRGEAMKRFLGEGLNEQPWSSVTYFAREYREEEKSK